MKFKKKRILSIIMAISMCMTCMAMPCKAKADGSYMKVYNLKIKSGTSTPGVATATYHLTGSASSNFGISHAVITLYRAQDNYTMYRSTTVDLKELEPDENNGVDLEKSWAMSHALSQNMWGDYNAEITIYNGKGIGVTTNLNYTIEKSWGSYLAGLYKYALLRDPELEGYIHNMQEVAYGRISVADMIRAFYNCEEYKRTKTTNEEYVRSLYLAVLGREPDPEGFKNHMNGLNNGTSRNAILNVFLASEEFNTRVVQEFRLRYLYNWNSILKLPNPIPTEDNPEDRMAHNIYVNPDLSQTSGQYTGFLIDFCTDCNANCTYWSLCNWTMDKSELEREHELVKNEGAYAGLQNTIFGKAAIMSFWENSYKAENGEEVTILASREYPSTDETDLFDSEKNGTNYIPLFHWEQNHWYRMYLNCYDDEEGYTLVEQWVQDMETKEWTKISCFNTGLRHSCFMGEMHQFMEDYVGLYSNEVRTFAFRNVYVREKGCDEWTGITKFRLSADTDYDNKKGTVAFAADENTLYGITCGYGPDSLELNSDVSAIFEIKLTEKPTIPN